MSFVFTLDGCNVQCYLEDPNLILQRSDDTKDTFQVSDVIGIEISSKKDNKERVSLFLHVIKRLEDKKWTRHMLELIGHTDACQEFATNVQQSLDKITKRPKKLLVFINPVSGSHTAVRMYEEEVSPLFKLARINTTVIVSAREKHIEEAMTEYDYKAFDGIVVCGGDGSVNQCFVPLLKRTQEEADINYHDPDVKLKQIQLPIGHIPFGTGNIFATIANGCVDVETAVLQIIKGSVRHLHVSSIYSGGRWRGCSAIIAGFGVSAEFFKYTEGFRWMKTLRYLVVPFYFYLAKSHKTYNADITLYKKNPPTLGETDEVIDEGSISLKETVTVNLMDLLLFNVKLGDPFYYFGSESMDISSVKLRISTESNRFQLLGLFINNMLRAQGTYEYPEFVKNHQVTGYKIKINEPELNNSEGGRYMLLLDGEELFITESEWETRLQKSVVAFYSDVF
ncbi:hypothetical protein KUTeg_019295 [Tegillarca granosa]|uniref:DAGKc domain-containing protein n=1 Tax=Tegillarca granosa TaxID=220873 RepID=A0ABQ9EC41_TEGGR|nr:hypothetical protein KUTeg_019295 [Tegillarca granosa]